MFHLKGHGDEFRHEIFFNDTSVRPYHSRPKFECQWLSYMRDTELTVPRYVNKIFVFILYV